LKTAQTLKRVINLFSHFPHKCTEAIQKIKAVTI
jgi:hypothetical protein